MACIRTLGQIGDERLEELMRRCLADADWRVRAVAAKDVRKCSDDIIPALRQVLCDSSYYVRLNAAMSLANKGEAGRAVLRECVQSDDKFGYDMASYALKQG
jgi:HEAT repeat protein